MSRETRPSGNPLVYPDTGWPELIEGFTWKTFMVMIEGGRGRALDP